MTDTLLGKEVMTDLHTHPELAPLLELPFDKRMLTAIARFGFEYEMLDPDDGEYYDDEDRYADWISDNHPGVPWPDDVCDCRICSRRLDAWRQALRDEYENEEGGRRSGLATELAQLAYDRGLTSSVNLHGYHCHCSTCRYDRTGPLMCTQADCSVGVEFVSRILDMTDPADLAEVGDWVNMMTEWKRNGGWMPDGHASCGNHVHVARFSNDDDIVLDDSHRRLAFRAMLALYAVYDWNDVADGACGRIRDYNSKPTARNDDAWGNYDGSWLTEYHEVTFEHRLWNTPYKPERLFAHVGISVALTRWAFAVALAGIDLSDRRRYMDALVAHRPQIIDQVRAYLPADACFDEARDLLNNVRSM